jgi:hypothetical protein
VAQAKTDLALSQGTYPEIVAQVTTGAAENLLKTKLPGRSARKFAFLGKR